MPETPVTINVSGQIGLISNGYTAFKPLMLRFLLLTIVVVWLNGCTHTRTFDVAVPEMRTEVNARAERGTARITFYGGDTLWVHSLHVAPDVTTWIDPATDEAGSAPTAEVGSIRFTNRGRGALEGLGLGLVLGAGAGALVGTITYEDPSQRAGDLCFFWCTRSESTTSGAVVFGTIGTVVGGVIGLSRGSRTLYRIPPSADSQ